MASEVLALEGIDASYGDSRVLHGVSFALQPGRLLGLLGRNGAGKTTCMSTVMGFLRPRAGSIRLSGDPIGGLAPEAISRRGVSLVPQGRRVFPSLSVRENLAVASRRSGAGGNAWSIGRVFETFPRLKERESQAAGSLSGGEQQMLAMGRALMARPTLLLLDEPSMGLSPILVETIFGIIVEINSQGTTVLLVEQNALMALGVAHRGYVLQTGNIVLSGKADELMTNDMVRKAYLGEE